jgi:acyl-CoA thioester hydrolase
MGNVTPPWDHPGVFAISIKVQADDIDVYAHVNNAVYLRWLTECAWAHSAAVGLPEERCVELRRGMAVREIHVEMLASAYQGEELLVGNWVSKKDRLRATRQYQIINPATQTTLLRGHLDFVCINLDNGRPTRMPPEFVDGYQVTLSRN